MTRGAYGKVAGTLRLLIIEKALIHAPALLLPPPRNVPGRLSVVFSS